MSLAELLPAIRALPAGEKVQLMHLLVDELGGVTPAADDIPEHLQQFIPPPGTVVHTGWQVTVNAAGSALPGAKSADDEFPEHLRHLIPPPGTVFEVWFLSIPEEVGAWLARRAEASGPRSA